MNVFNNYSIDEMIKNILMPLVIHSFFFSLKINRPAHNLKICWDKNLMNASG